MTLGCVDIFYGMGKYKYIAGPLGEPLKTFILYEIL